MKRIFALLMLLFFASQAKADSVEFNLENMWTWTLPQNATPEFSGNGEDFDWHQLAVEHSGSGTTFDLELFRLPASGSIPPTTNLQLSCDPFGFPVPGSPFCDYFQWVQVEDPAGTAMWNLNDDGSLHFIPGTYNQLTITEIKPAAFSRLSVATPEPSTLLLALAGLVLVIRKSQ